MLEHLNVCFESFPTNDLQASQLSTYGDLCGMAVMQIMKFCGARTFGGYDKRMTDKILRHFLLQVAHLLVLYLTSMQMQKAQSSLANVTDVALHVANNTESAYTNQNHLG